MSACDLRTIDRRTRTRRIRKFGGSNRDYVSIFQYFTSVKARH